jgi:hypothetical protein
MEVQRMRTFVNLRPGESRSCIGCHEPRNQTPSRGVPLALLRAPDVPAPQPGETVPRPLYYPTDIQPILDQHCIRCHGGEKTEGGLDLSGTPHAGFTKSYHPLCNDVDFWGGGTNPQNAAKALVPRFGGRNQVQITPPGGLYGALGSRLMKLLRQGHEAVRLSDSELRRLAAWIDLNAIFYGVNLPEDQARLLRGERLAMPQVQ